MLAHNSARDNTFLLHSKEALSDRILCSKICTAALLHPARAKVGTASCVFKGRKVLAGLVCCSELAVLGGHCESSAVLPNIKHCPRYPVLDIN